MPTNASLAAAATGSGSSALSMVLSIAVFIGLILVIRWTVRFARERSDLQSRLTNRSVRWWIGLGLCVGLVLSAVNVAISLAFAGMPTEDDELSLAQFLVLTFVPTTIVLAVGFGIMGWIVNRRQRQSGQTST